MTKKYLTLTEVAKILNLSRVAIFKRIVSGKLKAEKIGGRYLIRATHLGLGRGKLSEKSKAKIRLMVKKVFDEYGDVIKKLGNE